MYVHIMIWWDNGKENAKDFQILESTMKGNDLSLSPFDY